VGKRLATSGEDGTIRLWDVLSGDLLHTLGSQGAGAERKAVLDVRSVADTDQFASCGNDGMVRIWSWQDGALRHTLRGFQGPCQSVSVRANGGLLAAAGQDGTVRLWQLGSNPTAFRVIRLFAQGAGFPASVAFSPEGRYLATANADGTISILRLAGKEP
jgi:WD40 repeat protein